MQNVIPGGPENRHW